jgi:hypothetical protein
MTNTSITPIPSTTSPASSYRTRVRRTRGFAIVAATLAVAAVISVVAIATHGPSATSTVPPPAAPAAHVASPNVISADAAERWATSHRIAASTEAADHRAQLELRQQVALAGAAGTAPANATVTADATTSADAADHRARIQQRWALVCRHLATSADSIERCTERRGG